MKCEIKKKSSCSTPIPQLPLKAVFTAHAFKICPSRWTRVSMRWYFSGPLLFRYHRIWSWKEWRIRVGRTGALKHDLLDLAVLELTTRTSLIPRVILLGHKLVEKKKWERVDDFQTYTKNYEISGPAPTCPALLRTRSETKAFSERRGVNHVWGPLGGVTWSRSKGRRPVERFLLIRQQIWRCFMWLSTVNDFSLPSILGALACLLFGGRKKKGAGARAGL